MAYHSQIRLLILLSVTVKTLPVTHGDANLRCNINLGQGKQHGEKENCQIVRFEN
jgi:hypothetical protein